MNSDEIINSIIKPFVVEQPYEVSGEFYMSSSNNTKMNTSEEELQEAANQWVTDNVGGGYEIIDDDE